MRKQATTIRLLAAVIVLSALFHLILNLYMAALPFILSCGEMEKTIDTLSRTLGPIAVQADRNPLILCVKVTASALFLTSGLGMLVLRAWSRRLLFLLLGLRIMYGTAICFIHNVLHPHLFVIIAAGLFLFYYLNRYEARRCFI